MPKRTAPEIDSELVGALELGAMLGCRREKVYALNREGKLPACVRLADGPQKWRRREILDWIDAGMPDPDRFDWRPIIRMNLEQMIKHLHRELLALEDEIAAKRSELNGIS